jgi:hypothetical protein
MTILGLILLADSLPAATNKTAVVGNTREEVLASLGEPQGILRQGANEVFVYKGGVDVEFHDGRVIKVGSASGPVSLKAPFSNPLARATKESTSPAQSHTAGVSPTLGKITASILPKHAGASQTSGQRTLAIVGVVLAAVGFLGSFAAGIWLVVRSFRVHIGWGFACLFLPLAQVVFVIKHWKEGGKPFLFSLGGSVAGVLGLFLIVSSSFSRTGLSQESAASAQVAIKQTAPVSP